MNKLNIQNYSEIKKYINEGDILLFRGKGLTAKAIGLGSESSYTHVGIASWFNGYANTNIGILECVEFREGSGGRSVNLAQQVEKNSERIDVYRPNPFFYSCQYDENKDNYVFTKKKFDGKAVTRIMRRMTGLPYGWRRIWWMAKNKIPLLRWFTDRSSLMIDDLDDIVYPVCSTAVAYSFNSNGYDLVRNRSDQWTEPGDIARSTQINYLFTLK